MKYVTIVNNERFEIVIQPDGRVLVNGELREVDYLDLGTSLYSIITEDQSLEAVIEEQEKHRVDVQLGGRMYEVDVLDERALLMEQRREGMATTSGEVHSPMPGLIVEVTIEVGQDVAKGDTIIILESMKMQNELKSPIDGRVTEIHCNAGDKVDKNQLLVIVELVQDES